MEKHQKSDCTENPDLPCYANKDKTCIICDRKVFNMKEYLPAEAKELPFTCTPCLNRGPEVDKFLNKVKEEIKLHKTVKQEIKDELFEPFSSPQVQELLSPYLVATPNNEECKDVRYISLAAVKTLEDSKAGIKREIKNEPEDTFESPYVQEILNSHLVESESVSLEDSKAGIKREIKNEPEDTFDSPYAQEIMNSHLVESESVSDEKPPPSKRQKY